MRFTGPDTTLEMRISSGPDAEGWCKLVVRVESAAGLFTSPADPCLRADELERLEAFFRCEPNGFMEPHEIDFVEPELALRWSQGALAVTLSYALCPPWAELAEGLTLYLPADEAAMGRAADYVRRYRQNRGRH